MHLDHLEDKSFRGEKKKDKLKVARPIRGREIFTFNWKKKGRVRGLGYLCDNMQVK